MINDVIKRIGNSIYYGRKRKKTGVILAIDEFEALLEDFADLTTIAERENEESISHEEFLDELKANGEI